MRCFHYVSLALISAALQPCAGAFAQQKQEDDLSLVYGDKTTISIATGSQQLLRRTPAVATVITAEDIMAMGATDLDQVLETVPGLHVTRSAIFYSPNYVIRGIVSPGPYNPQVLMMQNGIPMTTVFSGDKGNFWGGMPLENVARVEIIRGPGSALYGADADAGVINIVTRTAAEIAGVEAGVRAGTFNTRNAWVQHGGTLGPLDIATYLRVGSTDGLRETIAADAQSGTDKVFATHASLALGPVHTGYDAIDASLDFGYGKWHFRTDYKLRNNLETGVGVSSALDPQSKAKSERIGGTLSWTDPQFARNWGMGLTASYGHF